jgi:hypothetical protein
VYAAGRAEEEDVRRIAAGLVHSVADDLTGFVHPQRIETEEG